MPSLFLLVGRGVIGIEGGWVDGERMMRLADEIQEPSCRSLRVRILPHARYICCIRLP